MVISHNIMIYLKDQGKVFVTERSFWTILKAVKEVELIEVRVQTGSFKGDYIIQVFSNMGKLKG